MRRLAGIGVGAGGTLFGHMVASLPSRSYTPSLRNTVSPALSETPLYPFFFFSFFSLFNRYLFSSLLSLSISFGRNVCFGVDEPEGSKKTLSSRGLLVVPEADELVFTDLLRAMPPPPLPPSPSRLNERLTRGLRMLQLVSSWILGQ